MKFSVATVILAVVATTYGASINMRSQSIALAPTGNSEIKGNSDQVGALTRPRRWIYSWLMGYGFLPNVNGTKKEESEVTKPRDDRLTSSVEVQNLPNSGKVIDLSGDTRVNYRDGHGRTASLANEGDAEVFDWKLLQEDRERNDDNFNVNPHYYAFHSRDEEKSQNLEESQPARTLYSGPYGRREVTGTGFIRNHNRHNSESTRTSSSSSRTSSSFRSPVSRFPSSEYRPSSSIRSRPEPSARPLRTFNRTPIAYDDSLQYISSTRRFRQPRN